MNERYPELEAERYFNTLTDDDMLKHCRQCKSGQGDVVEGVQKSVKKIDDNRVTSKIIVHWLKVTLFLNGFVIVASLFLLPCRDLIPDTLKIMVLLAILLLSACALTITVHAILLTIEEDGIALVGRILATIGIGRGSNE